MSVSPKARRSGVCNTLCPCVNIVRTSSDRTGTHASDTTVVGVVPNFYLCSTAGWHGQAWACSRTPRPIAANPKLLLENHASSFSPADQITKYGLIRGMSVLRGDLKLPARTAACTSVVTCIVRENRLLKSDNMRRSATLLMTVRYSSRRETGSCGRRQVRSLQHDGCSGTIVMYLWS